MFVVSEVLHHLIRDSVIEDNTNWRGLSMVLSILICASDPVARGKACELCCGLPLQRIIELANRKKEVKESLKEFLSHKPVGIYTEVRKVILE